jgi:hypothetical protein
MKLQTIFTIIMLTSLLLFGCAKTDNQVTGQTVQDTTLAISGETLEDSSVLDASKAPELEPVNDVAKVSNVPTKTIKEGEMVKFDNLKATDADGDRIQYSFSEPLDSRGRWRTVKGDAGEYTATITATDGKAEVKQEILIVVESVNDAPKISLEKTNIVVKEGETIDIPFTATDNDGDQVTVGFSGWMDSSSRPTSRADVGVHEVLISATDGKDTVEQKITIEVLKVNKAPQLANIESVSAVEGDTITVVPEATDSDGDVLTFSFSEPLNEEGQWTPAVGEAGEYEVTATVSDGALTATKSFAISIEPKNKPPVLELENANINVNEGETVRIGYTVIDPDGDKVTINFQGWMTGSSYTTTFDDAGEHEVQVIAKDGFNTVTKEVVVTVNNVNRAPVFDQTAFE